MESDTNTSGDDGQDGQDGQDGPGAQDGRAGYRRSAGSPRGEARRRELLDRVTDDLAANGLVDFSLRRAARAAGTTHKVLLYHFDGGDDLLRQAILQLRERRIGHALAAAETSTSAGEANGSQLVAGVRAMWGVLVGEESGLRVLDQAIGLAMYNPDRYADLVRGASQQYLPLLLSLCPQQWSPQRKSEVAEMILAVLRGFLVDWLISPGPRGGDGDINPGFAALIRALEREETANT
ncbi:TetR/AcrR family transcriptional regulator [Streptomyces sp. CA-111067]|uniref:TetR/AcrR family transcriptional regulator n=1 Tax=Streptomyces sp. CA-111067 TaxID=3240046 RepID=UPI003D9795F4